MSNPTRWSFCICNNTLSSINEILDAMDENGDVNFIKNLNMDELRSFNELMYVSRQFAKRAERAIDLTIDQNVYEVLSLDEQNKIS